MLKEYQKIDNIYKFNTETHNFIRNDFINPTIDYLKDLKWLATEKYNGTNTRIYWYGHKVSFYGRNDNSNFSKKMIDLYNKTFENAEIIFEQNFVHEDGSPKEVILFMENYGGRIQKSQINKWYDEKEESLIGFDVMIDEKYVDRTRIKSIFDLFNIPSVELKEFNNLQEIIDEVEQRSKEKKGKYFEGYVATPKLPLYKSAEARGRIITKIKCNAMRKLEDK